MIIEYTTLNFYIYRGTAGIFCALFELIEGLLAELWALANFNELCNKLIFYFVVGLGLNYFSFYLIYYILTFKNQSNLKIL